MNKKIFSLLIALLILLVGTSITSAQESQKICSVYFTGVGCPHCAAADPIILEEYTKQYENFIVIEYEIYQLSENGQILNDYISNTGAQSGVPQIIIDKENEAGERSNGGGPTTSWTKEKIETLDYARCMLPNGTSITFEKLNLNNLPGKPKIWKQDKILIKESETLSQNGTTISWIFQWNDNYNTSSTNSTDILKKLLHQNINEVISQIQHTEIEPVSVPLSGTSIKFDNAIEFKTIAEESQETQEELTLAKLISLAAVDAINPCALAVLTLMLIAIISYNPKNRKNILLAGLSFALSVFIMYLIYGLIIIKSFQLIQALTSVRVILYKVLGGFAIILGTLNIRDFFVYKPGTIGTEMPLKLRPKMKKLINGVTSPKGAFITGLFVTVFLLPCTIGPYVIAGGILSASELVKTIPPLLLYNLIFVLPMVILTFAVYKGFAKVEDISGWKDRNIKKLHLVAGIIMLLLGVAMILGLV